jgi:rieske iron-sulfur protein
LKPADLPLGGPQILAWPMDPATATVCDGARLNRVLVLRLDPAGFDAATRARAADGVVAYSAICPHAGCDVTKWLADTQRLECPCHYSQYDPKAGAAVVGGPSPHALPALPLKNADGRLVVAKPFTGRVGFQQI